MSCKTQTEKIEGKNRGDTLHVALTDREKSNLFIKDKSQYDQIFMDGLAKYNKPIKLVDNFMIVGDDTTYLPEDLPLKMATSFKGIGSGNHFLLSITRTNLTNLTYEFEIIGSDKETIDFRSGNATLGSMFFLASEIDEDPQADDSYESSEYWDKSNDCRLSLRIGIGKDDNGKQRAKITFGCDDKSKGGLKLDECPILRTE